MHSLLLLACRSVLDEPAAPTPIRPSPVATAAIPLARGDLPMTVKLPDGSRPGGAPATETFGLLAPFTFDTSRKKADVWRTPLPVAPDLLPTPTAGTHQFGSAPPPGLEVSGPDGPLPFELGGRKPGTWGFDREWLYVGVEPGWPAPDARRLKVTFAKAAAAENALNLATSGQTPEAFVRRSFTTGGVSHAGLYLPAPAEVVFRVTVPERGRLAFEAGVLEPAIASATRSDGADVIVLVRADGVEHEVERVPAVRDAFVPARIDLAAWAGREVELVLRTDPRADPAYDYVLLEGPTLYTPKEDPRRILMVFVDTLRRDRVGFYGYETHPTTPHLDRWAANAAVFEQARTVAPWTLPSTYAVLTGVQPEGWAAAEPLPETLARAGWRTDAIVSNAFLSQPFGLQRGWDRYRYEHLMQADDIVERALDVLRLHEDRDLLLMVHFMGPHLPYEEPWWYRRWSGFRPKELENLSRLWLVRIGPAHPGFEAIKDYVSDRYDQNVRLVDDEVAPLLEAVGAEATVVLFSDHGEEFWEHDGFEHGHAFWDEILRVPLALKSPHLPAGRFDAPVSLLDVAPTLREIAGVPVGEGAGRSLVPLAWGDAGAAEAFAARPQAFGRPLYGEDGWGVVAEDHKWFDRGGAQHVYALEGDPGERRDLAGYTEALERFPAAMGAALDRPAHRVWRIELRTVQWPFPLELTVSHPAGIADVWPGYDPRGRASAARPEVVDGRATLKIGPDEVAPETIYVRPAGDPLDPRGLAVTLVGRQVMVGGSCEVGPLTPAARTEPFLVAGDERFSAKVGLAWVPEPSGDEVAGFHADMAEQLRELGYLDPE